MFPAATNQSIVNHLLQSLTNLCEVFMSLCLFNPISGIVLGQGLSGNINYFLTCRNGRKALISLPVILQ